jgi:hypothetical protein
MFPREVLVDACQYIPNENECRSSIGSEEQHTRQGHNTQTR